MLRNEMESEETLAGARMVRFMEKEDPVVAAALRQELQRDEVAELLAALGTESRKRIRRRNWMIGGALAYMGLMATMAIATHNAGMIGSIGSMTGMLVAAGAATKRQKRATEALAQYDEDVRIVGPLAEALEFQDKKLLPIVTEKLISLLPKLKASDRSLLTADQRACLYRALQGTNPNLKLAVLMSLQQIGDSKALPYVRKLEKDSWAMSRDAIREAVAACIPFLTDLAEREKNSQTLLRAADGNATPSEVLLRPAEAAPVTIEPEQLLRASSHE
ncbi:MAG TPA: hypothetical protein VKU00_09470 [Chthonomonadaceae bacterium]|nr:hypothetical protein [Chthonomonadaceae bacterium]